MAHLMPNIRAQYFDDNGAPLDSGMLYTYQAGTSTPLVTYTDQSEATPHPNPIILDANGCADVWLGNSAYKFVLKDANDVFIKSIDNVSYLDANSVTTTKIADDSITLAKMADNSVSTDEIVDSSVTTDKIQNTAVTTPKIADANITTAKIADNAITTAKITDANVTTAKIADANVTGPKIADASITSAKTATTGIFTATPSPTTITSTTYVTIATGTLTKTGDGSLYGVFHNSNVGSVNQAYIRLQNEDPGNANSYFNCNGSFTLEMNNGSFSTYFDSSCGFAMPTNNTGTQTTFVNYPPGTFYFQMGNWQAGTYTLTLRAKVAGSNGTTSLILNNVFFVVKETLERHI